MMRFLFLVASRGSSSVTAALRFPLVGAGSAARRNESDRVRVVEEKKINTLLQMLEHLKRVAAEETLCKRRC